MQVGPAGRAVHSGCDAGETGFHQGRRFLTSRVIALTHASSCRPPLPYCRKSPTSASRAASTSPEPVSTTLRRFALPSAWIGYPDAMALVSQAWAARAEAASADGRRRRVPMMYVPQRYLRAAARADLQEDTLPQRFRRLSQRTRSIGHFVLHAGPALRTAPVCTRAGSHVLLLTTPCPCTR